MSDLPAPTTKRVSGDILDADGNADMRDIPGTAKVSTADGKVVLDVTGSKDGWDADAHIEMTPTKALAMAMELMTAAQSAGRDKR